MDSRLFEAARFCKIEAIRELKDLGLDSQSTPTGDNVLHVIAQFCDSEDCKCAEEVLEMCKWSFLTKRNEERATALHLAVRHGNYNVVRAIIEKAKTMDNDLELESGNTPVKDLLSMITNAGNTVLHEAVKSGRGTQRGGQKGSGSGSGSGSGRYRGEMVKLLLDEEPKLVNVLNNMEESPLYVAAEKGYYNVAETILEVCVERIAYTGPTGRTALHAAAIRGSEAMARELLQKDATLNEAQDDIGYTALHYTSAYGSVQVAKALLNKNKRVAYIPAKQDKNKTALHIASSRGHRDIMEEILQQCPDCYAMVTSQGQNVLHLALECQEMRSISFLLKQPWVWKIINQKDEEGNTSLHSLAASELSFSLSMYLVHHPEADINALNNKFMTPLDVLESSEMYPGKKMKVSEFRKNGARSGYRNGINQEADVENPNHIPDESLRKIADTHMIVAALVATIAFTAGFTILTGYDGVQGLNNRNSALTRGFSRREAFYGFVILDTIAMYSSVFAIFIHFSTIDIKKNPGIHQRIRIAARLIMISMAAIVLAFSMCLYAIFQQSTGMAFMQLLLAVIGVTAIMVGAFRLAFNWSMMMPLALRPSPQ